MSFRDRMSDAKSKAREALTQALESSGLTTTSASSGDAVFEDAGAVDRSATAARSATDSSATPVAGTGPRSTATPLPFSTTPAPTIPSTSSSLTVWLESLSGFVERGCPLAPSDLAGLPLTLRVSLQALATGRNEPVEAVVQQIAEFFVEAEAEQCEGPLLDALVFYMTQYQMPGVA